jgi:hypothetical protein
VWLGELSCGHGDPILSGRRCPDSAGSSNHRLSSGRKELMTVPPFNVNIELGPDSCNDCPLPYPGAKFEIDPPKGLKGGTMPTELELQPTTASDHVPCQIDQHERSSAALELPFPTVRRGACSR